MKQIKPKALKPGNRIAAVTLSWGGPGQIPHRYEAGKQQFEEMFDLQVVEMEHTCSNPEWIYQNPKVRAEDLMAAFKDDTIHGVISTIGGNDSIRMLPYLDLDIIKNHPKVFVGYSDTTVTHLALYKAGLVSFYGPAVMTGFAENGGIHPYLESSFRNILFQSQPAGVIPQNTQGWTMEQLDWNLPINQEKKRVLFPCSGWNFIQGKGLHRGHLIGGCLEVMEWLRGTPVWPEAHQWQNAILFLETSEEGPPPAVVTRALRAYAAEGVLHKLSGIIVGRPGGQIDPSKFKEYDDAILTVLNKEEELNDLPVISGMDFGHTDPIMTLPYGIQAEIDCEKKAFRIVESAVL